MKLTDEQWQLVVDHRHRIKKYVDIYWRGNGDYDEVEEAVMWGLMVAASRSGVAVDFERFSGWHMHRAARFAAIWGMRRRRRCRPAPDLSWVAEDDRRSSPSPGCLAELAPHLARLRPKQRRIARLRYEDGRSIAEIAAEVGIGRAGVAGQVRAIIERLRRCVHGEPLCRVTPRSKTVDQEPAGFPTGEHNFIIRFGDAPPLYLASRGWPNLVIVPAFARKFSTAADAVCHIEGEGIPRLLAAEGLPCGPVVVPESDPTRIIWCPAGGPEGSDR